MKFVICWYSINTNAAGHGSKEMSYDQCRKICDDANRRFPILEHFPMDPKTRCILDLERNFDALIEHRRIKLQAS